MFGEGLVGFGSESDGAWVWMKGSDHVYGLNNQMTDAGAVDFTYDHFGNTKTKVEGGNTTTYNWDDKGHRKDIPERVYG
ncbi:MAG: hypothetical protein AB1725_12475 [Armatimonadota bacterium]